MLWQRGPGHRQDADADRLGQLRPGGHDGGQIGVILGAGLRGSFRGYAIPLRCQRGGQFTYRPGRLRTYGIVSPVSKTWDRHDRISAISAVTISPRRRRLGLSFRLLPEGANAHGEDTVAFLRQLRDHIRGPMTILWDRTQTHDRSRAVKAYLAEHPEIVTEKLPRYCAGDQSR